MADRTDPVTKARLASNLEQQEWDRHHTTKVDHLERKPTLPEVPHRARKTGGSYQADGTVIAIFFTLSGVGRCVFEFDEPKGMLHIFSLDQVQPL